MFKFRSSEVLSSFEVGKLRRRTMIYQYGYVKPQRARGAEVHNAAWLGPRTLGIEVTELELAARCGLGNIDPQHLGGIPTISAIEAAFSCPLPAAGAKLVTIRPDADACGAMAVLTLRAEGISLQANQRDRISLVGRHDRFDYGPWPGPRPLPTRVEDINEVGIGAQRLGAIIAGCALPDASIDECVRRIMQWILTGEAPATWVIRAEKAAEFLLTALNGGSITIRHAVPGKIAVVEGFAPGALRVGYRFAPVVVAVAGLQSRSNDAPLRKITIGQYGPGFVNLAEVARLLSSTESGWGGSSIIIGSPQGSASYLSVDACVKILLSVSNRALLLNGSCDENGIADCQSDSLVS